MRFKKLLLLYDNGSKWLGQGSSLDSVKVFWKQIKMVLLFTTGSLIPVGKPLQENGVKGSSLTRLSRL
jgi:hypothetical protein